MIKSKITNSPEESKELAKQLSKELKSPRLIALYGNLGSGKTTFIQGLAEGLGIKKRVLSPTFVFIREYDLSSKRKFYHVDLYRLDSERNAETIGLSDIFTDNGAIAAIEWPEKIENLLPAGTMKINFSTVSENKRKIEISDPIN